MGQRGKGKRGGGNRDTQKGWSDFTMATASNKAFIDYYKEQGVLPESEWDTFMASLKTELPLTFRVTGSRADAETINDIIKNTYVPGMQDVELDGQKLEAPKQIPWYPGGLAWQVDASKRVVRKSPPFKEFQRFLVGETEVGNLSRQEAVSMIPPLFLSVEPHHRCLDMCAAPGSKTAQIIEALNPHHTESSGLLIANDTDYKRTHMLVHQTGRMPSKGLMVTNCDASLLPNISLGGGKTLLFDRILADVPCSGDGTLRKNVEIWMKWTAADGNSLHSLQLRILERAMQLLAPGGRLVYSTCSFNPAEDEAVIAAAMNNNAGQYTIVDVSADFPELNRRPGMTSWKVATQPGGKDTELVWHEDFESYRSKAEAGEERQKDKAKGIPETVWAPKNIHDLGMEKAMRLFPHDQNTGGFFVCVLEKAGAVEAKAETTAPVPSPPAVEEPPIVEEAIVADETGTSTLKRAVSPSAEAGPEVAKKTKQEVKKDTKKEEKSKKRDGSWKEDPFSYVDVDHNEVGTIVEWFKLKDTFRTDHFLVRNDHGDPLRTIYLSNAIIKSILQNNDSSRLRIVSAGVKGFVRQDSQSRTDIQCKWRVPNEGMLEVLPHVAEGIVKDVTLRELKMFVGENYPTLDMFHEDVRGWMEAAPVGNILLKVLPGDMEGGHLPLPIFVPVWRAKTSMSLLIDKREKSMLSLRVFGEDITKPHTANVRGTLPETSEQDGEATAEQAAGPSEKPEVDEEAALNA